jgi:hypothetical protein
MDKYVSAQNIFAMSRDLPNRHGKRPMTIGGPLHVQCCDHGDERALRHLLSEVSAWPDVEEAPWSLAGPEIASFQVAEDVATADPAVFIAGREFARILFNPLTIYLSLPLSCAHWAIIRGWAEPHCASRSGLIPPGIMVVYTPRDVHEVTVCRSLFWISYNSRSASGERTPWNGTRSGLAPSNPAICTRHSLWRFRNRHRRCQVHERIALPEVARYGPPGRQKLRHVIQLPAMVLSPVF